jgi:hypothetical protein
LRGQGQEKAINEALGKTEKFIYRSFYGKSPKLTDDKNEQAIHVNDFLKALKKDISDIEEVYDFLCEYVHPNYGSNLLVSTGQLGRGRLKPPEDFHRETLDNIQRYCSLFMLFLREQGIEHDYVFIKLQNLLELCFRQGVKVTNVFSRKLHEPQGDGKSRRTAFFFPKARTAIEAVNLSYEFLRNGGYSVQKRENGGLTDRFVYDIYTTNKGMVWFKIPMMKSTDPTT